MAVASSLQLSYQFGIYSSYGLSNQPKNGQFHFFRTTLPWNNMVKDARNLHVLSGEIAKKRHSVSKRKVFICRSILSPGGGNNFHLMQNAPVIVKRLCNTLSAKSPVYQLVPAIGVIALAWGLLPLMRLGWSIFLHKKGGNWKKSSTFFFATSYVQPLLLWTGALLICRALDPVILPSEASQAVKQRLLHFVRSFSTVVASAYCVSCLIQQMQKFFMEGSDTSESRNMGFQFAGKAIYTAVWVASVSLFMELLGFSTQRWLTAGGLGTVLLTLAGREIFTNFLSSVMIHATRPFIVNEWIQTKIEGYEVSGTVEHVGWWSPTIIRGDDREAVYIPNHKFTVNVVRNLSQKTHWRIKTHLAISHLDVNKINTIVADMRKVLAKNPQVEQQRLHRRVFLENINPENQALLILVSCFVKTSRFEEYLCVKEAILLDLLRVISHHRARLATPIRTIRKVYTEPDVDPFSETVFSSSRAATANRPFLLIEPSYRVNSENKTKTSTPKPDPKSDAKTEDQEKIDVNFETGAIKPDVEITSPSSSPVSKRDDETPVSSPTTIRPVALDENIVLGVALEGSKRTLPIEEEDMPASPSSPDEKKDEQVAPPLVSNVNVGENREKDENIVLGVALEGSKRTLPIEEEDMPASPPSQDEKKDEQVSPPVVSNVNVGENREKQSG